MLPCLVMVAVSSLIMYAGGWLFCRMALSLGRDEGYGAGLEDGMFTGRFRVLAEQSNAEEARRWQAEAQDDWLAT
jgi:hypothetical protein